MSAFKRWLYSLLAILGVAALSNGCQMVFGDFKVGNSASGGGSGQGAGSENGGYSSMPFGGTSGAPATGPIVVTPTSGLFTNDLGAQTKFYVSLLQKPTVAVTIPVASLKTAEGTVEGKVSPESLSFTKDDWNAPQAVTVTGVYDPTAGDKPYSVRVGPASSGDPFFQGQEVMVSLKNIDNDSPGFFVTPTSGLQTTEGGGEAYFTVVLNKAPSADVVISLESSDASIGRVNPASMRFTAENWQARQTATVTGMNDKVVGDRPYTINVDPQLSLDPLFAELPAQTVNVTNLDNDRAGLMVTLATGIDPADTTRLRTSENRESATFTVVLNIKPSHDVTIPVLSSSGEGTASPASLTFTDLNWDLPQTVTVTGENNENVADGNQPYQVKLGPVMSEDAAYGGLTVADLTPVNVINVDNDKADVVVTLLSGVDPTDASELLTTEKRTTAQFSIALSSKPTKSVHIELSGINPNEGALDINQVDFTTESWNKPQKVTVTGMDDQTKDGNVAYVVHINVPVSDDLAYQSVPARDVKVVNQDDDLAGITAPKLISGVDNNTKLSTTEGGGTASFSVALTSKPTAAVTLPVTSSTPSEGKVSPTTLTFTPQNYMTQQVVTLTGQNDAIAFVDGNQAYTVTVGPSASDDVNYLGLSQLVKATNNDDDSAYIVVTPAGQGTTTEKGGTATFSLNLHSQPTASVTLTFTTSDDKEGKVAPASLTYTKDNWSTVQNITVTGVDDAIADGDKAYNIAVKGTNTSDVNYQYAATTLSLTNKDDGDAVGLKITAAANLQTTEAGGKAMFSVALSSQPIGNVNVTVTSNNAKEGSILPASASLAFNATNWSKAQDVTVVGVDDGVSDANQTYTVSLKAASTADPKYAQLAASTVSLVNLGVAGVTVTSTSCATQPGVTATFSVVLKSQPLGPVSIALASDPPLVATLVPATLSFTASTWNVVQQVTVTGVGDGTTDPTPYTIVTAAAVSATDSNYDGLNAADVDCVHTTPPAPDP